MEESPDSRLYASWIEFTGATAELLGEAVDQLAAKPAIGPSRIEPLAVVGDRQAKLSGHPL